MWNKLTARVLTALVALVGAPVLGHLARMELAKDEPGLSVIVCTLVMIAIVLMINICTKVTK